MADDKNAAKKEKVFVLEGKRSISVNGVIYNRGDEVSESEYEAFPERVKSFFKPKGSRKK